MTSLAAQLAGIKANNNATILDKSKRKKIHSVSLIYDPKEAATQDFETIYYACLEGFRELETIDKRFSVFANSLFSETSVRFDRMVQTEDRDTALNAAINQFLMLAANYLQLQPTLLALEWLVRRFHINLHNTEQLILATLPWYNHQVFVRILDIIPTANFPALFQFLTASKSSLQGPSKNALVRVFSKDEQVFQLVNEYVLSAVDKDLSYNRLLVFWSSMAIFTLMVFKESNDTSIVDRLLPVISQFLPVSSSPASQTAGYMVLTVLCSQFSLDEQVTAAAISTICANWTAGSDVQGLATVSQLVRYSGLDAVKPLSEAEFAKISKVKSLSTELISLGRQHAVSAFLVKWAISGYLYAGSDLAAHLETVREIVDSVNIDDTYFSVLCVETIRLIRPGSLPPKVSEQAVLLVEQLVQREMFIEALKKEELTLDNLEVSLQASIKRPVETAVSAEVVEVEEKDSQPSESRSAIVEDSVNIEQSTDKSFLDTLPAEDRVRLWIRASACPEIPVDELLPMARVAPEAEASFLAAMALGPYPVVTREKAAKLLASRLNNSEGLDLQAFLPVVLTLLADPERRLRAAAAECLLALQARTAHKATSVWGLETVYGSRSGSLMWLSRSDQKAIYKQLTSQYEECVMDAEHIYTLAGAVMAKSSAFAEFISSHVASTHVPQILVALLRDVAAARNKSSRAAVESVEPFFTAYLGDRDDDWVPRAEAARIPVRVLDTAVCNAVSGTDKTGVQFLQAALRGPIELAECAGSRIQELWNAGQLKPEIQNSLLALLVSIATDERVAFDPAELLTSLNISTPTFMSLLANVRLQPSQVAATDESAAKRRRRRSSSSLTLRPDAVAAVAEQHLRKLTLSLELLDARSSQLESPADLFGPLFALLDELIAMGTDSNLPVLYTEELLANCLIHLVESVKASVAAGGSVPNLSSLRVDVIVSCIRTSQSPQVQNRLLLLVAALASLSPDMVLHSVMPIFTFMGANTVRLDNDYSAHVIQQTISQVIPALVACGDKQQEIEIALLSFVAAFPHVPRHRRNKLFGALIKTLGPEESLYKLLLLLAHKFAEAKLRKRSADAKALVHFTTPFLRSFSISQQLLALDQFLEYVSSAAAAYDSGKNKEASQDGLFGREGLTPAVRPYMYSFLTATAGNDMVLSGTQPLRVQIASSGEFTPENLDRCAHIIDLLLSTESDPNIHEQAFELLTKCLELLPIARFVEVVGPLVTQSANIAVKAQALELVASKFDYELASDSQTQQAAQSMLDVLQNNLTPDAPLLAETLDTIDSLVVKYGSYLPAERLLALLDVLAGPCGLLNESIQVLVSAVAAINSVCQPLGARMIGHFSRILPVLFTKCEQVIQKPSEHSTDEDRVLQLATFALVSGLVQRIPSFMSSCSRRVFELVFMSTIDVGPREKLVSLIAEKMDAQTVLSAFINTWPNAVQGGIVSVDLFLRQLDGEIEASSKKDVAAKSSQLIGLLLRCFGVRAAGRFSTNEVNKIETQVVGTGVSIVLKLNDKVFRPLFVRMVRWAFEGESAGAASLAEPLRQVVMFKFIVKLFGSLRSIVTNYFGYILDPTCAILMETSNEGADDSYGVNELTRKLIYQALTLSFASDNDDFWQSPSRFDKILQVLLAQLDAPRIVHGGLLVKAIVALAEASASQQHRQQINDGLAARIQPGCSSTSKIWAIKTLSALYTRLGEEWVGTLPQLVPLVAELLEDEDESVEMEVRRKLVPVIEDVLGESLDRYLS